MICPECQHDTTEHRLYGCNAGAEEEAEKARLWDALVRIIESTERPWERRTALTIQTAEPKYIVDRDTLAEVIKEAMEKER